MKSVTGQIGDKRLMTCRDDNLLNRFPPGFSAHRYKASPEEIEQLRRSNQIQAERDERHRQKLIKEGKLRPDPVLDKKPA